MNEMEFFAKYEIKPSPGSTGKSVEIWKRDAGIYGRIVSRPGINGKTEFDVYGVAGDVHTVNLGTRTSFSSALRLAIKCLAS